MQIDYVAKRSIKSGHSVDTAYQIDPELSRQDRSFNSSGNRATSLSGLAVTVVNRYDEIYNLETAIIQDASTPDNDDMIEFLDSVASGETFQLDLTGTSEDYIMESARRPYGVTRRGMTNLFQYRFRVRKL